MALEQKLSLRLAQRLVMTPSLQQAIKLLQMTRLELEGVLSEELAENPILEENDVANTAEESAEATVEDAPSDDGEAMSDIDLEAYFGDYAESWEGRGQGSMYEERQGPPLENTLTREPDLYDHLLWQLHMMDVTPLQREIAELIIGNLDNEGFLGASIAEIMLLGVPPEVAEAHALGLGEIDSTVGELVDIAVDEMAAEDSLTEAPVEEASEPASAAQWPTSWSPSGSMTMAFEPVSAPEGMQPEGMQPEGMVEGSRDPGAAAQLADDELPAEEPVGEETPADPVDGYTRAAVEEALDLVRNLDPPGVGCASLQESLLHQLEARGEPADSLVRRMIAERWEDIKRRKFEKIARDFGVRLADLKPAVEVIRSLETRPGRGFSTDRTMYVEPDVHVVKVGDSYIVQLNDDGLPRLRVSRAYGRLLKEMRREGRQVDAQKYIKEKMRSAMWLIKSLDQRQRTIYKVTNSIVRQQRAFLDHGIEHLRPMVLRDVAEDIEMHESTVSRVVSNKYVHTPRGLFPLKFFFHSGIDREYGGDISSLTVKRKIQNFVQNEDANKPLSDSELMRILKREGIQIARRTVAKYRDELGIPSSTDRKKIF